MAGNHCICEVASDLKAERSPVANENAFVLVCTKKVGAAARLSLQPLGQNAYCPLQMRDNKQHVKVVRTHVDGSAGDNNASAS